MDASPRGRTFWRGVALLFAVVVVGARLGVAGCSPAFFGSTKAGGGLNAQQAPAAATPPAATAADPKPAAAKPAPASAAATNRASKPTFKGPDYFPPTKAGGGFRSVDLEPAPQQQPQQQAPQQQAPGPR